MRRFKSEYCGVNVDTVTLLLLLGSQETISTSATFCFVLKRISVFLFRYFQSSIFSKNKILPVPSFFFSRHYSRPLLPLVTDSSFHFQCLKCRLLLMETQCMCVCVCGSALVRRNKDCDTKQDMKRGRER